MNVYRSEAWAWAATIPFLLLGFWVFQSGSQSDPDTGTVLYGAVNSYAFALFTLCGAILGVITLLENSSSPQELLFFTIQKNAKTIAALLKLVLFVSYSVVLSRSLWLHDTGLLKIAITSIVLYFVAVHWWGKQQEIEHGLMSIDQRLSGPAEQLRSEADGGDAQALFELGTLYENGRGVPIDQAEAGAYFRKAAEKGHKDAQNLVGLWHFHGLDYVQAVSWLRQAADNGSISALSNLGRLYAYGKGGLQYAGEYNHAMIRRDMIAQHEFSGWPQAAKDSPKDYREAYFWLTIATVRDGRFEGINQIKEELDEVAAKLSPAELTRVQERALKWLETHPIQADTQ